MEGFVMPTISISSHCGGVGRTTTVANISPVFASLGYKVLALDFSSQPNLKNHIGIFDNCSDKIIDKVLKKELDIEEAIVNTMFGFDFLGCSWFLGSDNIMNYQNKDRNILKEALESIKEYYDYIFIDLPARTSFIDDCGLVASDFVLIPISSSITSKIGLESVVYSVNTLNKKFTSNIKILGSFVCKNSLTKIDKKLIKNFVDCGIDKQIEVIEPCISKSVIFQEEGLYSVPTTILHRKHKVSKEYMDLALNINTRLKTFNSKFITSL